MPAPIHVLVCLHQPAPRTSERSFLEQRARQALAAERTTRVVQRARPGGSVRAFLARSR